MIRLVGSLPAWGLPDISPFVNKVDAYLRLASLPYDLVSFAASGLGPLPKGKIPVLIVGSGIVADSAVIIEYLKKHFEPDLDGWLNAEDRSIARAFSRMLDESLYWSIVQIRYRRLENYRTHYAPVLASMVRQQTPAKTDAEIEATVEAIREMVLNQFQASGRGRHGEAEVEQFAYEELDALTVFLGDKPYFFGDRPAAFDAHLYAFLACIAKPPFDSPIRDRLLMTPSLRRYVERIDAALDGGPK